MRFQFHLEGLLRVRRLLELQAREQLDKSMMRIHTLEHSLAEAHRWSEQTARTLLAANPLPACELQFAEAVLCRAREAILQCERRKEEEEQRASELRQAYLKIRRDRKTVSTLRENALHEFQIEQSRHAQAALDELFLGKLIHSRSTHYDMEAAAPKLEAKEKP